MKTFNKRGDQGETSLLYGVRVAKSDARPEAYGTIDEAVSTLGLARSWAQKRSQEIIYSLQRELFIVGAELATTAEHYEKLVSKGNVVTPKMVQHLEDLIDELEAEVEMPKAFIIPGGCPSSAALDMARAIVRRAERRAVSLRQANSLPNKEVLKYLNRMADLIFTLARYEEVKSGV